MTRIKAIIAAGTLTGMVLVTGVAFGVRNLSANSNSQNSSPTTVQSSSSQPQVDLQTMLEREAQYRQQLDAANKTIQELQSRQAQRPFTGEEHEGHEDRDD